MRFHRPRSKRTTLAAVIAVLGLATAGLFSGITPALADSGDLVATNPTLDFGAIYVDDSTTIKVDLKNNGADPVNVNGLMFSSSSPSQINGSAGTCVGDLSAGEICRFVINLHPTVVTQTFSESITADLEDFSYTYTLKTKVLDPMTMVTSDHSFGNVPVGQSVTLTSTFQTSGFSEFTVRDTSLPVPAPFLMASNCSNATLSSYPDSPHSNECTIDFSFTPTQTGPFSTTATVILFGVPREVLLTGVGITPELTVAPKSIDFEYIPVGSTRSRDFTVTNTSGLDLTLPAPQIDVPAPFTATTTCTPGLVLASQESCTYTVTFAPVAAVYSDEAISLSIGASSFKIQVTGLGFNEPDFEAWSLTPLDLDFGEVLVGDSKSLTSTLTFIGEGSGTIFPKDIDLGGPFTLASDCETYSEIGEGESCTFTFTFTPTAVGDFTGSDALDIYGDTFVLTAKGTGFQETTVVDPDPTDPKPVDPKPLDPKPVDPGETPKHEPTPIKIVDIPKKTTGPVVVQKTSVKELPKTGAGEVETGAWFALFTLGLGAAMLLLRRGSARQKN